MVTNHKPLYQQIVDRLIQAILRNDYLVGDPLPSIRARATSEGVNPNTIKKVYALLEEEGWIERRQGSGTFVSEASNLSPDRRRGFLKERLINVRQEARL